MSCTREALVLATEGVHRRAGDRSLVRFLWKVVVMGPEDCVLTDGTPAMIVVTGANFGTWSFRTGWTRGFWKPAAHNRRAGTWRREQGKPWCFSPSEAPSL